MDTIAGTQIGPDGKRHPIDEIPRNAKDRVNPAEDVGRDALPGQVISHPTDRHLESRASGTQAVAVDAGASEPVVAEYDVETATKGELLDEADRLGYPVHRSKKVDEVRAEVILCSTPLEELSGPKLRQLAELYGFELTTSAKGKVDELRAEVAALLEGARS